MNATPVWQITSHKQQSTTSFILSVCLLRSRPVTAASLVWPFCLQAAVWHSAARSWSPVTPLRTMTEPRTPSGTGLAFQLKTAATPGQLGAWVGKASSAFAHFPHDRCFDFYHKKQAVVTDDIILTQAWGLLWFVWWTDFLLCVLALATRACTQPQRKPRAGDDEQHPGSHHLQVSWHC